MHLAGIAAKTCERFKLTADLRYHLPVTENHLDRNFTPAKINQAWTSDITHIATREGWLYMATV